MARGEITYSQVIAWLKVGLPLIALTALSTMFMFSEPTSPTSAIPFAKVELEAKAKDQQITAPYFSGQTDNGHAIEINSKFAKPDPENARVTYAEDLHARIKLDEDNTVQIQSDTARMNSLALQAELAGNLQIQSSNGYNLQGEALSLDINAGTAFSESPITGAGPAGEFTAGGMQLTAASPEAGARFLFTNGVNLLYTPQ